MEEEGDSGNEVELNWKRRAFAVEMGVFCGASEGRLKGLGMVFL